ncbi:MAG TPA: Cof-type HAD-IIB family hydrolase [Acetivibrio sp.]|uniref:Cof-type HAD-IIB family hydrolase n=1 Tax=Acetivibrio sp. TaxID=1872092 RepID=UPI002CEFDFDC|nr:Cof-type HAD-IIB family hydrolase [Acetivibrio sp.]HOM03223.1 Cof-type HAD-IIB family hydrolase [Acetivibrio sp.]
MERKFKGLMLVSDLDGTLLNSRFEISEENIKAISYFVDNGGVFTIATGRMELGVREYLKVLPVNAPVILYNGALIYDFDNEKNLWTCGFREDIRGLLKEVLDKFPYLGIEIFPGGDNVYLLRENEETEKHRKKEGFNPILISRDEIPEKFYKVILTANPQRLPEVEDFLKPRAEGFRTVYSEKQFLEILDQETSKGRALIELAKMMGIEKSKVISIGDNQNDIEMIETSGTGFAVENAHPELIEACDCVCVHHDSHAAGYVVDWIEKNKL